MPSVLSYCLSNLPKNYISTYLLDSLEPGRSGALLLEVMQTKTSNKILIIETRVENLNLPLKVLIFNYSYYHRSNFLMGAKVLVHGTIQLETHSHSPVLINPKLIKEANTIKATFKKKGLTLEEVQARISLEALVNSGIGHEYARLIYEIFHPTLDFVREHNELKGLPSRHLEAVKFIEIFYYTQRLERRKASFHSKFQCHVPLDTFIQGLPFKLTKSQMAAIDDIAKDLASEEASRRLVMGDVGCGKTLVILASVVLAYPHKSMLMAPTSILANQLYEEAKKFLPPFIKACCVVSGSHNKVDRLDSDFVIGTQALLFREEDFGDFALVMTDEQHRFGTEVRATLEAKLTSKGAKPHNIQFSATPIPRTLAMLRSSLINFSFIRELPFKKDIETFIINDRGFGGLLSRIKCEIDKQNQVAIIHPLIEEGAPSDGEKKKKIPYKSLKEAQPYWERNFEFVFSTSGRDKEKEEVLRRFGATRGALLLATTMVEVGISLPHLSVIVIVGAERLGLASLHQLRGRVSRNGSKGYCYLYTNMIANERLIEFSKTLSGFDIAELDLKYRNSGDLVDGSVQSGHNFEYFDMAYDTALLQKAQEALGIEMVL